jgi:hypothetical protein
VTVRPAAAADLDALRGFWEEYVVDISIAAAPIRDGSGRVVKPDAL